MTIDELLEGIAGAARIVTLKTKTYPRLLKKGRETGRPCPFRGVHRICYRNGIIGCSYENSVNNQRAREGQPTNRDDVILYFDALELWNGKGYHEGRFLVRHRDKDNRYITFMPKKRPDQTVVVLHDQWKDQDGNNLDPAQLQEFLPPQTESRRQMVDRTVAWRTIDVDNLLSVTYGGEEFPLAA